MSCLVWLPLNSNKNNGEINSFELNLPDTVLIDDGITGKYLNGYSVSFGMDTTEDDRMCNLVTSKIYTACVWILCTEEKDYYAQDYNSAIPVNINQGEFFDWDNGDENDYYETTLSHRIYIDGNSDGILFSQDFGEFTNDDIVDESRPTRLPYLINIYDKQWHHLCITVDSKNNNTVTLYIDGQYQSSVNDVNFYDLGKNVNRGGFSVGSRLTCSLCDYRIYDEVLNEMQIKDIAKALCCHYRLDNGGKGNSTVSNIIEDVSGFGNDGQIDTASYTVSYNSNSPRYSYSTLFSSPKSYFIPTRGDVVQSKLYISSTVKTAAVWAYISETYISGTTPQIWTVFVAGNSRLALTIIPPDTSYMGGEFGFNVKSDVYFGEYNTYVDVGDLKLNDFNHFCVVKQDDGFVKLYINGIKQNKLLNVWSNTSLSNGKYLQMGGLNAESYISDLRIYGTALSEEEIMQLYKSSAWIDKSGNLWGYAFVKDDKVTIGKNGVITAKQFTEIKGKCNFIKNGINANGFIEI